ncbi:MAG: aminopeptidase P family N-terminal domain-containing protein, partial [Lachnospiraceae bacterium]|nr:aminopeptidase P family N-terminal domain-containing protein [Lachnospiraceae bacterium]
MMKFEKQRMNELRMKMKKEGISFCLIPSTDYHASEYIADYFKVTEFFSGCTSDNVTLVISEDEALLWTDGRYFISAAKELEGTGIKLMKTGEPGVPCVKDYLKNHLKEGDVLGYDGRIIKALHANEFRMAAAEGGWKIRSDFDPAAEIWTGRPALP